MNFTFQLKIFLSSPPASPDHSVEERVETVVGNGESFQKSLEPVVSFARAFFVYEVPKKQHKLIIWKVLHP